MASGLATRCSACGTVFRVVPDQLRVSEGWVRCGRCTQVFNALEGLVDMETGLPRPGAGLAPGAGAGAEDDYDIAQPAARPGAPPLPPQPPAPTPALRAPSTASQPRPVPATARQPAAQPPAAVVVDDAPSHTLLQPSAPMPLREAPMPPREAPPEDLAAMIAEASDSELEPRRAGQPAPSFVRSADRAARWRRPQVRALLAVLALLGAGGLAAQVAIEYRDLVAARSPGLRPLLQAACAPLGCTVEAARAIDSLAVESSGLVRVERSDLYKLQVSLRNRAGIDLALPALDVTLTDSQGRLVARKVLRVAEMGAPQATIPAGRDLSVQATLQAVAGTEAAAQPIAGYTIELFYP